MKLVIKPLPSSSPTSKSIYLETSHLKIITTCEGPIFNSNLETSNAIKLQISINLPSYSSNLMTLTNNQKEQIENRILKTLQNIILLQRHKKSLLKIRFDVLEYSSDIFHYCVMSASLGLSFIGIEQKGIVSSSKLIILKNGDFLVDPSFEEERLSVTSLQLSCIVDTEEVVSYYQNGFLGSDLSDNSENENRIMNEKFSRLVGIGISVCKAYNDYMMKII